MAKTKVVYTELMGQNYLWVGDIVDVKDLVLDPGHSDEMALFHDTSTMNNLVIEGTGLEFKNEHLTDGKITTIVLTTSESATYLEISGKFDGEDIGKILEKKGTGALLSYLFDKNEKWVGLEGENQLFGGKGNDRLIGGTGDDWIIGASGTDKETGNEGSDYFDLYRGSDKDIVTDFHASGGDGIQDYIYVKNDDFKIRKDGDDTIIDYGHGDMLILKDVARNSVNMHDVQFYS